MAIAVRWGSATHAGRVRTSNEDAILAGPTVFAVADGMGGHAAGDVASAIAIARMAALPSSPTGEEVLRAVQEANAAILSDGPPGSAREGMGTTLSAVVTATHDGGDALLVVNVGDSRTYLMAEGRLAQVTRDHSLVAEMVREGELRPEDARSHRARNVVTRALGITAPVEADHWWIQPEVGQRLLVCSDGLTNEVDVDDLVLVLRSEANPQTAVDRLVQVAMTAGARDNVSAVLVVIDQVTSDSSPVDHDTSRRARRLRTATPSILG